MKICYSSTPVKTKKNIGRAHKRTYRGTFLRELPEILLDERRLTGWTSGAKPEDEPGMRSRGQRNRIWRKTRRRGGLANGTSFK